LFLRYAGGCVPEFHVSRWPDSDAIGIPQAPDLMEKSGKSAIFESRVLAAEDVAV
jgi:hypothetical protein